MYGSLCHKSVGNPEIAPRGAGAPGPEVRQTSSNMSQISRASWLYGRIHAHMRDFTTGSPSSRIPVRVRRPCAAAGGSPGGELLGCEGRRVVEGDGAHLNGPPRRRVGRRGRVSEGGVEDEAGAAVLLLVVHLDTWGCRRYHIGLQVPLLGRYSSLAMHPYLLLTTCCLLTITTYSLTHLEHEALILGHVWIGVPLVRSRVAQ